MWKKTKNTPDTSTEPASEDLPEVLGQTNPVVGSDTSPTLGDAREVMVPVLPQFADTETGPLGEQVDPVREQAHARAVALMSWHDPLRSPDPAYLYSVEPTIAGDAIEQAQQAQVNPADLSTDDLMLVSVGPALFDILVDEFGVNPLR